MQCTSQQREAHELKLCGRAIVTWLDEDGSYRRYFKDQNAAEQFWRTRLMNSAAYHVNITSEPTVNIGPVPMEALTRAIFG